VKILLLHNYHRSGSSSGDDVIFRQETELLKKKGHEVIKFNPCNDEFARGGILKKLSIAIQIPWSFRYAKRIRDIVIKETPHIVHVHNFFPLLSPSVYHALKARNVPVVQTLHDFRFLCAIAFFMRDGRICEECKDFSVFRSVRYGCFRHSRLQSLPVALMMKLHNILKTFKEKIDAYICLTEFQKKIFTDAGYPEEKIFIKPNLVEDTFTGRSNKIGDYLVFIGRLGEEKGLRTLIEAWRWLPDIPLKVIGDGPDASAFKTLVSSLKIRNIEFLGYLPHNKSMDILDNARFLVMPSIWYETFGLVIVEAFSHYKPVIASNLGAMAELVTEARTGLLFEPGNAEDLARKVQWLWNNPEECLRLGLNARREYEERYTPEKNYEMLISIYEEVLKRKR